MAIHKPKDDDVKLEIGHVISYDDDQWVVEDIVYKHGWKPDMKTKVWGSWLTLRKLKKDLSYNPKGCVTNVFLEELQQQGMLPIIGRMQKLFMWPERETVINNAQIINGTQVGCSGTVEKEIYHKREESSPVPTNDYNPLTVPLSVLNPLIQLSPLSPFYDTLESYDFS
jgi:hypothetical protein